MVGIYSLFILHISYVYLSICTMQRCVTCVRFQKHACQQVYANVLVTKNYCITIHHKSSITPSRPCNHRLINRLQKKEEVPQFDRIKLQVNYYYLAWVDVFFTVRHRFPLKMRVRNTNAMDCKMRCRYCKKLYTRFLKVTK